MHSASSASRAHRAHEGADRLSRSPARSGAPANPAVSGGASPSGDSVRRDAGRREQQSERPQYALLGTWLNSRSDHEVQLTFKKVEKIIGGALPPSARSHRSWWGNDETHSHAKSWLSRGFFVTALSLQDETVTFRSSPRLSYTIQYNMVYDYAASRGVTLAQRLPISDAKRDVPTLRQDRQGFEAMCEGLRRAGSAQIAFHARVHEPPQRGRRTEGGYASILVYERHNPTTSVVQMTFGEGQITVVGTLGHKSLRSLAQWPGPRRISGLQFVGLWQLKRRFLVGWPTEDSMQSDEIQLVGAFTLSQTATPQECLRVCTWVLREARAFEDGLRKVLFRKRAIYPMRALRLADTYLARYVRPPISLARSMHRIWAMDPTLFFGADESPFDPMLKAFGRPSAGA